jgi:hypothetical protein
MFLEPEQEELLAKFVEAHRSAPREERGSFTVTPVFRAPDRFIHLWNRAAFSGSLTDAEVLADRKLLRLSFGSRGNKLFYRSSSRRWCRTGEPSQTLFSVKSTARFEIEEFATAHAGFERADAAALRPHGRCCLCRSTRPE